MSTWLQKQLVAFGKRLWTDREPIDRDKIVVPFPKIPAISSKEREEEINTLSELSSITLLEDQVKPLPTQKSTGYYQDLNGKCFHNLNSTVFQDMDRSASVRAAVALQDQMVRSRDGAIQKMLLEL